ncbi:MAG: hypothetical protein GX639_15860 [Fibrobacter sp.]|nr:hypothetical protein [Fibrobacter sp.]
MKRLIATIATVALVMSVSAQTKSEVNTANAGSLDSLKVQLQAQIGGKLDNISPEIQNRLQDAKNAVEAARNQYRNMNQGNVDAAKAQARANADSALGEAIRTMEHVSAQLKTEVEKAKQEIQTQLQTRIEEAKQLQTQVRQHDGSGKGGKTTN